MSKSHTNAMPAYTAANKSWFEGQGHISWLLKFQPKIYKPNRYKKLNILFEVLLFSLQHSIKPAGIFTPRWGKEDMIKDKKIGPEKIAKKFPSLCKKSY